MSGARSSPLMAGCITFLSVNRFTPIAPKAAIRPVNTKFYVTFREFRPDIMQHDGDQYDSAIGTAVFTVVIEKIKQCSSRHRAGEDECAGKSCADTLKLDHFAAVANDYLFLPSIDSDVLPANHKAV